MLKLQFAHIKDPQFTMALRKLMSFNGFKSTQVAYNIAKIGRKFDNEAKLCQELFLKHVKQFAKLNEKGEIAPRVEMIKDEKGVEIKREIPGTYEIAEENREAFAKASEEFDKTEFEVECHRVKLADVEGAKLTPSDLLVLEPILTELEATPDPKANGAFPTSLKKVSTEPPAPMPA